MYFLENVIYTGISKLLLCYYYQEYELNMNINTKLRFLLYCNVKFDIVRDNS